MSLPKLFGYKPMYRSDFLVQYTLSGLCRVLGNPVPFCPTLELQDLLSLSSHVNLRDMNERVKCSCVFFSFRTLLCKSNIVSSTTQDVHVLRRDSVYFYPWGTLVKISSIKTIHYGQRLVELPIANSPGSPLCAVFWLQ